MPSIVLVMAGGLMQLVRVRPWSHRPWLAVVKPPPPTPTPGVAELEQPEAKRLVHGDDGVGVAWDDAMGAGAATVGKCLVLWSVGQRVPPLARLPSLTLPLDDAARMQRDSLRCLRVSNMVSLSTFLSVRPIVHMRAFTAVGLWRKYLGDGGVESESGRRGGGGGGGGG